MHSSTPETATRVCDVCLPLNTHAVAVLLPLLLLLLLLDVPSACSCSCSISHLVRGAAVTTKCGRSFNGVEVAVGLVTAKELGVTGATVPAGVKVNFSRPWPVTMSLDSMSRHLSLGLQSSAAAGSKLLQQMQRRAHTFQPSMHFGKPQWS
jgi:hypothetical protein